jgi:hypothetical protein
VLRSITKRTRKKKSLGRADLRIQGLQERKENNRLKKMLCFQNVFYNLRRALSAEEQKSSNSQAGLLTRPWRRMSALADSSRFQAGLTVAVTVRASHPLPYYPGVTRAPENLAKNLQRGLQLSTQI